MADPHAPGVLFGGGPIADVVVFRHCGHICLRRIAWPYDRPGLYSTWQSKCGTCDSVECCSVCDVRKRNTS